VETQKFDPGFKNSGFRITSPKRVNSEGDRERDYPGLWQRKTSGRQWCSQQRGQLIQKGAVIIFQDRFLQGDRTDRWYNCV
jgi:hypothetical protein